MRNQRQQTKSTKKFRIDCSLSQMQSNFVGLIQSNADVYINNIVMQRMRSENQMKMLKC